MKKKEWFEEMRKVHERMRELVTGQPEDLGDEPGDYHLWDVYQNGAMCVAMNNDNFGSFLCTQCGVQPMMVEGYVCWRCQPQEDPPEEEAAPIGGALFFHPDGN